jgi:RNA polymerase sigma-70 factor, ECF subfamily
MQQPSEWADEYLVRSIRSGHPGLYRTLVERYAPMVFSVVRRYCRDADEAEDLAQNTFVTAFNSLSDFDQRTRFSSWLYAICLNQCRDHARRVNGKEVRLDAGASLEEHLLHHEPTSLKWSSQSRFSRYIGTSTG